MSKWVEELWGFCRRKEACVLNNRVTNNEPCVGEVIHYYNRIGVAVIDLCEPVHVGDMVHIMGFSSDFRQQVNSLQIDLEPVDMALPHQDVAMKVDERVRRGDKVFKIEIMA